MTTEYKLRKYQERGVEFFLAKKRVYFAVDMAMGKTAIALSAMRHMQGGTLVIAPIKPLYTTWPEEREKWSQELSYEIIHGVDKAKNLRKPADIYLLNFDAIPFLYKELISFQKEGRPFPFENCIVDEGTYIKSPQAKRWKYLHALLPIFSGYRAILSGTPAPNGLLDLWSQYYFLLEGKLHKSFKSYGAYRNTYFIADSYLKYSYKLRNEESEKRIYKIIAPYTFRLDADDYIERPPIEYKYRKLQLTAELKELYAKLKRDFCLTLDSQVECSAVNTGALNSKLRQFIQGFIYYESIEPGKPPEQKAEPIHQIKLQAFKELVEEVNQPILCAIQFKYELSVLKKAFPSAEVIAGGVSAIKAQQIIQNWNKGLVPILLCHPASISHGTNLQTGGCIAVWYGLTWDLGIYLQFNRRLHRPGQTKTVQIIHLILEKTIDETIIKALNVKNITQQKLLDYLKQALKKEDEND